MTSLFKTELELKKQRYETLSKTGRRDAIVCMVLDRMAKEINNLERRLQNEERPRKENDTCRSASTFTQHVKQAFRRCWLKCNGNHYKVPRISGR